MDRRRSERARTLRFNATDAEEVLWAVLRNRGFEGLKWRRQAPIDRFFADFACKDAKIVVELDGRQHDDQGAYDAARTRVLEEAGFHVVRFTNREVLHGLDGVLRALKMEVALARGHGPHLPIGCADGPLPLPKPGEEI